MLKSKTAREIVWLLSILASAAGLVVAYKLTVKHVEHEFKAAVQPADTPESPEAVDLSATPVTQPALAEAGSGDFLDEICEEAPDTSCDEVSASEWGTIKFGEMALPTSQLGAVFFLCMLCWQLVIGDVSPSRAWMHWIYVLGAIGGVLSSIYFEVIMWTQLDKWCPLCVFTHVMTVLLLVFAILLRVPRWPKVEQADESSLTKTDAQPGWPTARALFVTVMMAAIGTLALNSQRLLLYPRTETAFLARSFDGLKGEHARLIKEHTQLKQDYENYKSDNTDEKYHQLEKIGDFYKNMADELRLQYSHWAHTWLAYQLAPQLWIDMADRPAVGPEDAKHVVTIFSDFQCPVCVKFEQGIGKALVDRARTTGDVRVVFIQWPICIDCNPTSTNNLHPLACKAAYAAEAAYLLGGDEAFWTMHDILYDRQKEWTKQDPMPFVKYAEEIGLDPAAFEDKMNSEDVRERVAEQVRQGMDLGLHENINEKQREYLKVKSTPSVYVNNKRFATWGQMKVWQQALQSNFEPLRTKPDPPATQAAPAN